MKYVKCNVKLLNEINLLTIALVSAVNMIECLTEIKDNSNWTPFIDKYIQQTKKAEQINSEDILQEDIFLEEKTLIEKGINIINSKKTKLLASEIEYLNETYKYFTSCPVSYLNIKRPDLFGRWYTY